MSYSTLTDHFSLGWQILVLVLCVSGSLLLRNWGNHHHRSSAVRCAFDDREHDNNRTNNQENKLFFSCLLRINTTALHQSLAELVQSLQYRAGQVAYHLPPCGVAVGVLLLLFDLPPLLDLAVLAVLLVFAIMSWMHDLFYRKRCLTPLPISSYSPYPRRAMIRILPPFLPEEEDDGREAIREHLMLSLQSLRRMKQSSSSSLSPQQEANEGSNNKISLSSPHPPPPPSATNVSLGYALVTGASRGIGRAFAVELARYGFPLILVARDEAKLVHLARDLADCYGSHCCVLAADLCLPNAAEKVYEVVKRKGIPVDLLFNNAGFATQGLSVDLSMQQIDDMIALNIQAVSTLTHLFGKDMKERKRGRILIVSSLCGITAGIASVAVYAATKAFERSLAISLAKELEPFGVGVTCLLPGAVRDTEFRSRSRSSEAVVWKAPCCTSTPPQVASFGVRAVLQGETEVIPGWMNVVFARVLEPVLPQRLHNLLAEFMWNPPQAVLQQADCKNSTEKKMTETISRTPESSDQGCPALFVPPPAHFSGPPLILEMDR